MAAVVTKSFDGADETRPIEKGKVDIVNLGETQVMRATFEPGWRWSECVKPVAGTDSCQVAHLVYVVSGRMGIKMDDGSEAEIGPGDVTSIPPGHDAWIIGDEPFVGVDFQGGATYAKPES
ncbi:MAG: cupin domain-containing protein [Armatimonadota bacterium]|nr:cupin domain-containing protein [Armatimonadota bacterium]